LKPVNTNKFRKFLAQIGCRYDRTEGGHEIWDRNDLLRPVVFRAHEKEIPPTHLRSNLRTLGIEKKKYEEIMKRL
jgi:predicted RNA binding protein YcfA (HicA-like mRNA interferase family)